MAPVQWQLTCILDKRYEEVELSSGELSTKTYVTPKIAFWNTDAYGDTSKAAVCWNGRKFSSEFTDLSVGWNVLTSLEEVEEGHVPDYDFDAYLYLHAIGPAKPEHAIAEEYLTTATWNVLAKEAAFKIEERCHIGADGKLDDGREVKALYPIGQVKIRNSTPEVKQCMAGACEFLEMGWGRDGGGQGSGGAD